MWDRSVEVKAYTLAEYGFPVENPQELARVFRGNVRSESSQIGLSQSTAGDGMALLNAMRCVTLLKPGGPKTKSIYLLNFQITLEEYEKFRDRQGSLSRRVNPSKWDTMLNDMTEMKMSLKEQGEKIAVLEGLVSNFLERITNDGHDV
jgi:hypothetical protein